jgi:hypothetical protein
MAVCLANSGAGHPCQVILGHPPEVFSYTLRIDAYRIERPENAADPPNEVSGRFLRVIVVVHRLLLPSSISLGKQGPAGGHMTREPIRSIDEVLRRVQGEFLEMPGLRLTEAQARRLWGLDVTSCHALLNALVDANFLFRTRDGAFMRVESGSPEKPVKGTAHKKIAAA